MTDRCEVVDRINGYIGVVRTHFPLSINKEKVFFDILTQE